MAANLIFGVLSGMAIFVAVLLVLTCCYFRDWAGKAGLLRWRLWRKGRSTERKDDSEASHLLQRDCQTPTLPAPKSSRIVGACGISEKCGEQPYSLSRTLDLTEHGFTCGASYGTFDRSTQVVTLLVNGWPPRIVYRPCFLRMRVRHPLFCLLPSCMPSAMFTCSPGVNCVTSFTRA